VALDCRKVAAEKAGGHARISRKPEFPSERRECRRNLRLEITCP
jgi:hypothetical protein